MLGSTIYQLGQDFVHPQYYSPFGGDHSRLQDLQGPGPKPLTRPPGKAAIRRPLIPVGHFAGKSFGRGTISTLHTFKTPTRSFGLIEPHNPILIKALVHGFCVKPVEA